MFLSTQIASGPQLAKRPAPLISLAGAGAARPLASVGANPGNSKSRLMSTLTDETLRRRTFAIISHPDAGKTTLTEKLLLFGGAIQLAGEIRARGERRRTRSERPSEPSFRRSSCRAERFAERPGAPSR